MIPVCLPPRAPSAPKRHLPVGSTDCHCHVYDDPVRYPLVEPRSYTPALAPMPAYRAMCDAIGITRTVQVSASVYGFDNSLTLDAIREFGIDRARGVAGIAPDTADAELDRLHAGGIRGVRLSTHVKGYGGTELVDVIGRRIRRFGWHVQLHVAQIDELVALAPLLHESTGALVFDHLGCVRGRDGVGSPGFQAMLGLLRERDDCWVKLSSWYRRSSSGPPSYADMKPLAQALVEARPDRVVFGTNWPHPNLFDVAEVPDDGNLVDVFHDWVPDDDLRERILIGNPARLYGFGAA
ncbi:amidohydrolase family protein [soil metagenome]